MAFRHTIIAWLIIPLISVAYASEWRYAGYLDAKGAEAHQFFDAESITRPTQATTRVWVKSIRQRELDRYWKAHEKALVEKVARGTLRSYCPAFFHLPEIETKYESADLAKFCTLAAADEIIANDPDVRTFSTIYYEFDCADKRVRVLQSVMYDSKGRVSGQRTVPGDYQFISPDSNGQWLSRLVCHPQ